jgi:DNA-binding LacI/PurR family transcriptional regulator
MSIALGAQQGSLGQQVAQRLRRLIARRYRPGDVLPTYRELAAELGVGLRSVSDGMNLLATQGLVKPVRRIGTRVVRSPGRGPGGLSLVAVVPRGRIDELFLGYRGWILSGIGAQIERQRLSLLLFPQRNDALVPVEELLASGADSILLVGVLDAAYTQACLATDLPVVLLDQADESLQVDSVVCDNPGAARHVVELLVRLGHRRIAYAHEKMTPRSDSDSRERAASFAEAMNSVGLVPAARCELSYTGSAVPNACADAYMASLRSAPPTPSAVVTDNESTLRCLQAAAHRAGIRVPEDLSLAALAMPPDHWAGIGDPLSGCCMDFSAMGHMAIAALERRSRYPTAPVRQERVPFRFCPGQTLAPLQAKS